MSVYINQFQSIEPQHSMSQDELVDWLIDCHITADENNRDNLIKKIFRRYGVNQGHISQRFFECPDILSKNFKENIIYQFDSYHKNGADINIRAKFFQERCYEVLLQIYKEPVIKPNHLIHVTCTGYISPSVAQKIMSEEHWEYTDLTHAYHMGCYASLPAVRLAKSLVDSECIKNKNYQVDIVHNEICSLHMDPLNHSPQQVVIQTLFADGHIKYTLSANKMAKGQNFKILTLLEKIIPDSFDDMSWIPGKWGMQMNLSADVPLKIKKHLKKFSDDLFKQASLEIEVGLSAIFAIHPGGPKIIDAVQDVLELKDIQVNESRKVLHTRGNMSSATLPHVWREILNSNYSIGTKIVSFAFGPGLTLVGSIFEVC